MVTVSMIAVIVALIFILFGFVFPVLYHIGIEHHDTRKDYCAKLAAQIASDKANHLNATILTQEIKLYHNSCSG